MKECESKPIVPIFFAIDNNYVPLLAVALASMKANSSRDYFYEIYILNNGVCEKYQNLIKEYEDENYHINYVDLNERIKSLKLHVRDYYTTTIYFRLFIADIFPMYDKALYLDADIVVKGDIAELFNHDISNYYLGVIKDDVANAFPEFVEYTKEVLGVPSTDYFNSGILVMNLKKFREEKVFDQFITMLNKVKYIIAPDQDYLNIICHHKVLYIDSIWNTAPLPNNKVKAEDLKLIHYKLTAKPWHYANIPYANFFWDYAKQTPFYDQIVKTLENYSEEDIKKDSETEVNLLNKSKEETLKAQAYYQKYGKLQHE